MSQCSHSKAPYNNINHVKVSFFEKQAWMKRVNNLMDKPSSVKWTIGIISIAYRCSPVREIR